MWFEKPDAPTYLFAARCGAYVRVRPPAVAPEGNSEAPPDA
jgi:hypothetical protein